MEGEADAEEVVPPLVVAVDVVPLGFVFVAGVVVVPVFVAGLVVAPVLAVVCPVLVDALVVVPVLVTPEVAGVELAVAKPTELESMLTAAVEARARPSNAAPVLKVMATWAMTIPLNTVVEPKVAELPTCQKIFSGLAPPARITLRPLAVVRVEAIWKTQTALELPSASRVRSPEEISADPVDL